MAERKVIRRGKEVIDTKDIEALKAILDVGPEKKKEPDEAKQSAKKKTSTKKKSTSSSKRDVVVSTQSSNRLNADPNCFVYFAVDFTSLRKNNDMIAISLVDAEGNSFSANFVDYDISKVSTWTFTNIIKKLKKYSNVLEGSHWTMTGTAKEIGQQIMFWLDEFIVKKNHGVQFVGDCSHYAFVNLCELLLPADSDVDATSLPHFISRVCVDINQDMAMMYHPEILGDLTNFNPYANAFGISRESLAESVPAYTEKYDPSDTLSRAKAIRALHRNIWGIEI